jgi:lipoprotein-anchoring transpeptidase ErfK/SrfK
MNSFSRRGFISGLTSIAFGRFATNPSVAMTAALDPRRAHPHLLTEAAAYTNVAAHYGSVPGEPFPVPAVNLSQIDRTFLMKEVAYAGPEQPGTIVIDPESRFLFLVQDGGTAIRYGVGVGRAGFGWSGAAVIKNKQEWPDWYPPEEMVARQPELWSKMSTLQSGIGMPGGPGNPLGARAMYLWQGNRDTLYRVHGTVEPWTIGKRVSSGCIRMINQDAIDLYDRVPVGTQVIVLGNLGDRAAVRRRSGPDLLEPSYNRSWQAPEDIDGGYRSSPRARVYPYRQIRPPYDPYSDGLPYEPHSRGDRLFPGTGM